MFLNSGVGSPSALSIGVTVPTPEGTESATSPYFQKKKAKKKKRKISVLDVSWPAGNIQTLHPELKHLLP